MATVGAHGQVGFAEETVYGTPVTVTRFFEFRSEEITAEMERIESEGIHAGSKVTSNNIPGGRNVEGDVEFEIANRGFGLLFKHMLGGVATATPATGTLSRDHTLSLGALDGKSLTGQVGVPKVTGGAAQPKTAHGLKVSEWEITNEVDGIALLTLSFLGEDLDFTTALATASYPTGIRPFTSNVVTLSVFGTPTNVSEVTFSGNNNLADDRRKLGSNLRLEPLEDTEFRELTGELSGEFENLTVVDNFLNGAEGAVNCVWQGDLIEGALRFELEINYPRVVITGDVPNVGGRDIVEQPINFKALAPAAGASAVTIRYRTDDAAP